MSINGTHFVTRDRGPGGTTITPYTFSPMQRRIILLIHQRRAPMTLEDFVQAMGGSGRGYSVLRSKLKRCIETMGTPFLVSDEVGGVQTFGLTPRSTEIALNLIAASLETPGSGAF